MATSYSSIHADGALTISHLKNFISLSFHAYCYIVYKRSSYQRHKDALASNVHYCLNEEKLFLFQPGYGRRKTTVVQWRPDGLNNERSLPQKIGSNVISAQFVARGRHPRTYSLRTFGGGKNEWEMFHVIMIIKQTSFFQANVLPEFQRFVHALRRKNCATSQYLTQCPFDN